MREWEDGGGGGGGGFFFQAEDGIRGGISGLEFRRVLFRSKYFKSLLIGFITIGEYCNL